MTTDIQFISVVDSLLVTEIEEIPDADPRTIRVSGERGFNATQRVFINDYGINSFVLVDDRTLLVSPPSLFDSVPVEDMRIEIAAAELTGLRRARILFGPTRQVRKINGLQKLVQQVVKVLLTNAGTNKFNLSEGGNLVKGLGSSLTPSARSKIATIITQALALTEEQIVAAQAGSRGLPSSERLLSLRLVEVVFDETAGSVSADIQLTTFAGRGVTLPLTL